MPSILECVCTINLYIKKRVCNQSLYKKACVQSISISKSVCAIITHTSFFCCSVERKLTQWIWICPVCMVYSTCRAIRLTEYNKMYTQLMALHSWRHMTVMIATLKSESVDWRKVVVHVRAKVTCTCKGHMYVQRSHVHAKVTCTCKGHMYMQETKYGEFYYRKQCKLVFSQDTEIKIADTSLPSNPQTHQMKIMNMYFCS